MIYLHMVSSMTLTTARRVSHGRTRGQIKRTVVYLRICPGPTTLYTLRLCPLRANAVSSSLVMPQLLPPAAAILTHLAFLLRRDFSKRVAPRKWLPTWRLALATHNVGPVSHSANSLLLKRPCQQCPHRPSPSYHPHPNRSTAQRLHIDATQIAR